MLGVSSGLAAYLGSLGTFLVAAPLEEPPPLGGVGEVGRCAEEGLEDFEHAGGMKGGGRGGGVSSRGGKGAAGLLSPSM